MISSTSQHRAIGETFAELLQDYARRLQRRKRKRQSAIARDAWLDESYVCRLLSGERSHPSRDVVIMLGAFGLELALDEVDDLLLAADFRPLVLPRTLR